MAKERIVADIDKDLKKDLQIWGIRHDKNLTEVIEIAGRDLLKRETGKTESEKN